MSEATPALTVFPDTPLRATVVKGEAKVRYFNPANFFERVQVISPTADSIAADLIAPMSGDANTVIYASGWTSRFGPRKFMRLHRFLEAEVDRLVPTIAAFGPQVIRGYGSQIPAWLAVEVARRIGVPSVISLHADYDRDIRQLLLQDRRLRPFVAHAILGARIESETIRLADRVICAYGFLVDYARRRGAKDVRVIYNRVDVERFAPAPIAPPLPFTVLCVSRLSQDKDPSELIRAMRDVDGRLKIVGDGVLRPRLEQLARDVGVADRVDLIASIEHARIESEYRKAHVFAAVYRVGGVSIPMLEAMASGLSIVVNHSQWERSRELVNGVGIVVEGDAESFAAALNTLRADDGLRTRLGVAGRERAVALSGEDMERLESELYRELIARF